MEFLYCYLQVSSNSDESDENQKIDNDQISLQRFIDDAYEIENNPSEYYYVANVYQFSIFCQNKKDGFLGSDTEDFLYDNTETKKIV